MCPRVTGSLCVQQTLPHRRSTVPHYNFKNEKGVTIHKKLGIVLVPPDLPPKKSSGTGGDPEPPPLLGLGGSLHPSRRLHGQRHLCTHCRSWLKGQALC